MKLLPQYYNLSEGFNFKTSKKNSSHASVISKRDKWLKYPKNENSKSKNTKLTMRSKKAVILNNNPSKTTKDGHQNINKTKDNGNGINCKTTDGIKDITIDNNILDNPYIRDKKAFSHWYHNVYKPPKTGLYKLQTNKTVTAIS
jgi:hypothetical protein